MIFQRLIKWFCTDFKTRDELKEEIKFLEGAYYKLSQNILTPRPVMKFQEARTSKLFTAHEYYSSHVPEEFYEKQLVRELIEWVEPYIDFVVEEFTANDKTIYNISNEKLVRLTARVYIGIIGGQDENEDNISG